ncbi:MAG: Mfa1 fimbrilin C-terminal domain-containing protein [Prevotella sp.]|nr:Mfa1 fimbrilin C-terminal domain-containing protein [Prevotella sp.]
MKKQFLFVAVLAAGLAVTSCSSGNDAVVEQPQPNPSIFDKFDAKGEAKVSFLIATASSSTPAGSRSFDTMRAAGEDSENDNYVMGDADEYAIKDATLVLFQGSDESSAEFLGAYTLTATSLGLTDNDVSDLYTATISNQGISSTSTIYALIMANAGSGTNNVLVKDGATWKLNGTALSSSTKFSAFQTTALDAAKLGNQEKGMLMSNAPQSAMYDTKKATAPTYSAITTLVKLSGENFATTQSSASANPVRVFIERAAAKVQVTLGTGVTKVGTSGPTFTSTDVKWVTDNMEPTFYTVRVAEGTGNSAADEYRKYTSEKLTSGQIYRFLSAIPESTRTPDLYRTYWAIDPHYYYTEVATDGHAALVGTQATDAQITNAAGTTAYEYIPENTFNEFGMTKNSTTRVLLSFTFNGGADFFTVDGTDAIFTLGASSTDGTLAKKVLEYVLAQANVQTWITNKATAESSTPAAVQAKITVEVAAPGAAGAMTTGITVKYDGSENATLTAACGNIYAGLNPICYKDGKCYYQVRIKHFGDSQTPLGTPAGSSYTQLYGDPATNAATVAKNFMGRYAVVRNNWYIIRVTAVKQIGSATIPTPDWTPDDDNNQYITTEIYVNKWAQRTQDAELY